MCYGGLSPVPKLLSLLLGRYLTWGGGSGTSDNGDDEITGREGTSHGRCWRLNGRRSLG